MESSPFHEAGMGLTGDSFSTPPPTFSSRNGHRWTIFLKVKGYIKAMISYVHSSSWSVGTDWAAREGFWRLAHWPIPSYIQGEENVSAVFQGEDMGFCVPKHVHHSCPPRLETPEE